MTAAGCQSQDAGSQTAVIVNPSAQAITELEKTISMSLYGVPVTLGADVFADGQVLTVETRNRNNPNARLATGRIMSRPEQFRLIARGDDCLLEKLSTGERFLLSVTRCQPIAPTSDK
jgi:hypothetical protein